MDLVEIRKKAKKLKESEKTKEEDSAESIPVAASEEPPQAKASPDAPDLVEAPPETGEEAEDLPEATLSPIEGASVMEEAGKEASPALLMEEAGTEDFLSGVLDVLYEEERYAEEEEEDIEEFLCFRLSDEEYAVDIHHVKEIIKMMDITEVPKTPYFMLGIISLRGVIIPLLDLRARLSLEISEYTPKTRIIIASSGDTRMGMVVDSVTEVVRFKKGAMEAPPAMLTSIDVDLLKGVCRHEERLLIIPNLTKVFDIKI